MPGDERAAKGELQEAIVLANKILDRPHGDPDDDLAVLSRQLLRCLERASGWRDIASAPRDGRFVLLHVPEGLESGVVTVGAYWKHDERADNGRFQKGNWDGWLGMDLDIMSSWCDPTHWMPLPEPPPTPNQRSQQ